VKCYIKSLIGIWIVADNGRFGWYLKIKQSVVDL